MLSSHLKFGLHTVSSSPAGDGFGTILAVDISLFLEANTLKPKIETF